MLDVLVLGSGIAGLSAAIHAAPPGLSVVVLTKAGPGRRRPRSTRRAGSPPRSATRPTRPSCTSTDTLTAGADLCDVDAVRVLVTEGPARVRELMELGAEFDRERRRRGRSR